MDLSKLNESQLKAVTHRAGPLMIIAGAGTGKTNVITNRIAWLIEQGLAKPSEIVALTFTEKAAAEMSERLERLIGHNAIAVNTATFHGFCQSLIARYGLEIGVTPGAPLLSEVELWLLLHREFERFSFLKYFKPHGNPTKFLRSLIKHFLRAKDENISVEQYRAFAEKVALDSGSVDGPQSEEAQRWNELAESYETYQTLLLERGVMDFGDLLLYANRIVNERPSVRAKLQTRYKYIVVDEFQDTNMAQYDLVRALLGSEQNITVVGDDDQAIYKFRGASVDNILQFRAHFPARTEVFLTENYRSHQEILDAAYGLIQYNNPDRLEVDPATGISTGAKKLSAVRGGGGAVVAHQFPTGISEAKWIAVEIARLIAAGSDPKQIAVLARASSHLEETAGELRRLAVPYVIAQTDGLLRTRVAIDMMALLRVALERHNSNAWYQISISRISKISPVDVVETLAHARRKNVLFSQAMLTEFAPALSDDGKIAAIELAKKVVIAPEILRSNRASVIMYQLLEQSGYFRALVDEIQRGSTTAMTDMTLVNQFLEFIAEWEAAHPAATPYEFLADCDRLLELGEEGQQALDLNAIDAVQLLTVHASKGLEFETVFIVSMIEGRFPGTERANGIELPDGLVRERTESEESHTQEERRLAYVAATRAKDRLYISCAEKYSSAENSRVRKPSRFIVEAGLEFSATLENKMDDVVAEKESFELPIQIPLEKKESFSFTQLKSFETCPYQYWFAHVLKLPIRSKWTMNFGRSIHGTLQEWYELLRERAGAQQVSLFETAAPKSTEPPEVSALVEMLKRNWISDGYPTRAFEDKKRAEAETMMRDYYREHSGKWTVPTFIEQRFKMVIGGEVLTGSIDRMDALPSGEIEIIDYKTGSPKTSEDLKFEDKEQLLIYQLAATRQFNQTPTLLSYYYVQNNEKASFVAKEKDLEKIEKFVGETVAEIRTSNFAATPSSHACGNCDFKDVCPYRVL
ncbi:MAG: ATP-dependent DNA helicase [Candidatus Magasanikbacteria bacterium]|nr:ATP-dependent DNA helicase [Candidatus Magasanikbacteria bacterium]